MTLDNFCEEVNCGKDATHIYHPQHSNNQVYLCEKCAKKYEDVGTVLNIEEEFY